jgi:hypothetical protein
MCWGRDADSDGEESEEGVGGSGDGGGSAIGPSGFRPQGIYKRIVAGDGDWFCGIRDDDSLECWGDESDVEPPPAGQFKDVALDSDGCAVALDGSLRCWGQSSSIAPSLLDPPAGVYERVATGTFAACAITTTGGVRCWGEGSFDGENAPPRM